MNLDVTTEWSVQNARACAEAAAYAYRHECPLSTPLAHAAVLDMGPARVIAFRGTACLRDWLTDLDCKLRPMVYDGLRVHEGFRAAAGSIRERVAGAVGWWKGPVFLTGHSLGGALAQLVAWWLEVNDHPVQGVYTFGSPRVGNGEWARSYAKSWVQLYDLPLSRRTYRVVLEEDIVPRVPGVLMGYRHAGREYFLPSIGSGRLDPPLWLKLVSDAWGTYRDWRRGRVAQLADHGLSRYLEALGSDGQTVVRSDRSLQTATGVFADGHQTEVGNE